MDETQFNKVHINPDNPSILEGGNDKTVTINLSDH